MYLALRLKDKHTIIGDVRGIGLAIAVEVVVDAESKTPAPDLAMRIVQECCHRGLMMLSPAGYGKCVMRLCPPLDIPQDLTAKGCAILEQAVASVAEAHFTSEGCVL
jgi:4-aminobutyrate aminotransferase-like enzyme